MSRIPDLLGLMESTNDFYLVAPGRNDRSVYIQVDDICELAMKSWLYEDTLNRQEQATKDLQSQRLVSSTKHKNALRNYFNGSITHHQLKQYLNIFSDKNKRNRLNAILRRHKAPREWSADKERGFKNFEEVIAELKVLKPIADDKGCTVQEHQELHQVLDNIIERRRNRNAFFHDHKQTGLTITQQNCLSALTDLYRLCELLFSNALTKEMNKSAWAVCRLQIIAIRLKQSGVTRERSLSIYEGYLRKQKPLTVSPSFGFYEYRLLHEDAFTMYEGVKSEFDQQIIAQKREVERVEGIKKPTAAHLYKRQQAESTATSLIDTWRDCFGEEWKPPLL